MEHFKRWRQILYASGTIGQALVDNIFGVYLIFFLLPPKETGMPEMIDNRPLLFGLTAIGLIILFGRVIDSLADPLIAHWSDNSKKKIGRRKFFLVTGSFPLALFAALMFFPPVEGIAAMNAVYVAVVLGLYFFFFTWYVAPYLALIPELSESHKDRILITVLQAVFSLVGAALVLMVVPILWDAFEGAGMIKADALKVSLIIMSVLAFISLLAAALPVDEGRFCKSEPAEVPLIKSIKMTLMNRTYIIYMLGAILFWFSFNIIRTIIAYYPVVLLGKEQSFQTLLMVILFGSAAVCFLIINAISANVTNKTMMLFGLLCFALGMSMTYIIDMMGEARLLTAYIQMAFLGIPVAILLVVPNAIVADISEVDSHRTGINREAMFFGTQGLFMKINYGIAAAIASYLFSVFGKDAASPMGVKLAGPVGGLFSLIGFLIFLLYPQKEVNRELKEIREERESEFTE